ncbi:MAG: immunoglobulin domain-containing protein [Bacteroidota bacterium]
MMHQSPRLAIAVLAVLVTVFLSHVMQAQFLVNPQPGEIFREYSKSINSSNDDFRVTDPNSPDSRAQGYLPNHTLSINIGDLQGAVRAEIIPDLWGGHAGTTGKRFRFNSNAYITLPEMGTGNGIPAGHDGQCYVQQFNPTVAIPLSHLVQGNNTFQGTSAGQTCYSFNWGQWGWYGVVVRIYYNSSKPHATGSISSPSSGSTIGENPTVSAATSGGATSVDFLAYYNGYDFDGDGVFQQYHHGYHRLKSESSIVMKNHVGTDNSSPFSATWNTNLVPNQGAGSIKLLARIKDANGIYFISNEVINLTLQRTGSVRMYKVTNVPERFWVRNGRTPRTVNFTIPTGDNLANATAATLMMATWNGNDISENASTSIKVNSHTFADFGGDHFWSFDAIAFPKTALRSGSNDITITANTAEHGIEGLWPGPVVIVRYSTGGGGNTGPEITQHPSNQSVTVGETATFTVQATGSATLVYQWQKNNSNISGATSSSYTTPPAVIGDNGSTYRCVVTNGFGNATSNSATLTVTITSGPNITQHPANQSVGVGQTATFNVGASGAAPLSYQWQKNNSNIAGATSSSYTTPPTVLADNGATFRCMVSNLLGGATSNSATLTVTQTAPASNLITNPGFESGITGWSFNTSGAGVFSSVAPGFDGSAKSAKIDINTQGTNVQMYQSGRSLQSGRQYRLSFAAYSNSGHDLSVYIHKQGSPYTNYGLNNFVAGLTATWQTFSVQFTATGFAGSVNDARVRFWFSPYDAANDDYFIDKVVLELISEPGIAGGTANSSGFNAEGITSAPTEFSLGDNYPNPFNPTTTISYGLSEDATVSIAIYDILGQQVITLADEFQSTGNYTVLWDGRDIQGTNVGSGVYFYRMSAVGINGATFTALKKMILMK